MIKKVLLILIILSISLYLVFNLIFNDTETVGQIKESEKSEWKIYTNDEYGFQLDFPKNWTIYESFEDEKLEISFYKDQFYNDFPLDYFSNTTHFSIYPNGIAQSGVIGIQKESLEINSKINESVNNVNNFVLEGSDQSWVTFINFENPPENWKSWGFVLMRNKIGNYEEKCFNGEQEVTIYECNPFEGDNIKRFGEINNDDLDTQLKILETFRFIK